MTKSKARKVQSRFIVLSTCLLSILGTNRLSAQPNRILDAVEVSRRTVLTGSVHPSAKLENDQGPVDSSTVLPYITLTFAKSEQQQTDLDQLLRDQLDSTSPMFHRWLTPEQYADKFGASQEDIDKVKAWLESAGLKTVKVARGRDFLVTSGGVQEVGSALRTRIHYFAVGSKRHFANVTEPSMPEALAPLIGSIQGLNDFGFRRGRPIKIEEKDQRQSKSLAPKFFSSPLGMNILAPDDLATIYNVKPLYQQGIDGSGQSLVVIGRVRVDMTDIQLFRSAFNLPPNDPEQILVPGASEPTFDEVNLMEADLDLEWAGAIALKVAIKYVFAPGLFEAVQYSVDNVIAPVITFSFGLCELPKYAESVQELRQMAQRANAQGITWIASSGDSGAAGCEKHDGSSLWAKTGLAVSLPASIPEVTAIGGTRFAEGNGDYWRSTPNENGGTANGYIPETSWNDSGINGSTGGGGSILFLKPAWQSGLGVPFNGRRNVPDVSLTASWSHQPYALVTGGQYLSNGGTSASAPSFAAMIVLLNQYLVRNAALSQPGLGNINPSLYYLSQTVPSAFHDITTGNNRVLCLSDSPDCVNLYFGFSAGPGYDQVTGLGSVDAYKLVKSWTSRLPLLAVTELTSNTTIQPGAQIALSVTIANQGDADTGAFKVGLFLLNSAVTDPSPLFIGGCDYQVLSSGATNRCAGSLPLPTNTPAGRYFLLARADDFNQVTQLDRAKNIRVSDSGVVTVSACSYNLTGPTSAFPAGGGTGSITISTQTGCSWNAASDSSWVTLTSSRSGSGTGSIGFSVGGNTGSSRTGGITVGGLRFVIAQSTLPAVVLQFTNKLIYAAIIKVNGALVGTANASGVSSFSVPATSLEVSFEMIRPTFFGAPIGEPLVGYYNTIYNPVVTQNFNITNQIGSQSYFAPVISNNSNSSLLIGVNGGLSSENRCYCTVGPRTSNVSVGYYKLSAESNLRAYSDGSNYFGGYYYFQSFMPLVELQTGILRKTFTINP